MLFTVYHEGIFPVPLPPPPTPYPDMGKARPGPQRVLELVWHTVVRQEVRECPRPPQSWDFYPPGDCKWLRQFRQQCDVKGEIASSRERCQLLGTAQTGRRGPDRKSVV